MPTLSCIGAGSLGKTICHLLSSQLEIQQIINRSPSSSQQAVDFIGTGTVGSFANLAHADIWLIATPDDDIEALEYLRILEIKNYELVTSSFLKKKLK